MNFDKHFEESSRRINSTRKIILWGIGIIFALILSIWVLAGVGVYQLIQHVDFSHGLKGVVEQVWYGK